jgi:hypothetical protein
MRAILSAMGVTAALAMGLAVLGQRTAAQETKAPPSPAELMKALAEAGKPGPQHKKLQPFIGDWDLTVKLWTDPEQPPAEAKGTVERKWIMGGRFVQETSRVECNGKECERLGLIGYDNGQKKFTIAQACGVSGTISHSLATCNDAGTKFECAKEECCPLTGQKVKGRDELLIEGNDKIVVNVYRTVGGKEIKMMEITSTRKK